jgi:hypothetical protein
MHPVSVGQRRVWRRWGREFLRQRRVTPSRREIEELVQKLERVASEFFRRGALLAVRKTRTGGGAAIGRSIDGMPRS